MVWGLVATLVEWVDPLAVATMVVASIQATCTVVALEVALVEDLLTLMVEVSVGDLEEVLVAA